MEVLKYYLGENYILNGFIGLMVIAIVVMLLTRKPKR